MAAPDFAAQNLFAETAEVLRTVRMAPTRARFSAAIVMGETAADLLTCAAGFIGACLSYGRVTGPMSSQLSLNEIIAIGSCFGILVTFLRHRDCAYHQDSGVLRIRETERNIRVTLQSLLLIQIYSILLRMHLSVFVSMLAAILVPALLMVQKYAFFNAVAHLRESYQANLRVLIYGTGETGRTILSALLDSPRLGLKPIAIIDDRAGQHSPGLPAMGYRDRTTIPITADIIRPEFLQSFHADLLLIASAGISLKRLAATQNAAEIAGLNVGVLTGLPLEQRGYAQSLEIDGLTFAMPSDRSGSAFYPTVKRMVDMVLSTALLIALSPLLLVIALLIRLDSPGPSLFVQKRVGKDGDIFRMYKFRTMYASTPKYELSPTTSKDRRITQIGRSLRRSSLDELPQLFNVLLGNMSLVGPRPEMPFIVQHYTAEESHRHVAVPGITGLWQLSADRAFPIHQNLHYDFYYIRNRTLSMDFAILAHTLIFAVRGGI